MAEHETLIEQLQGVGFTNHESRCFIALIERHPATAYEIAKRAGVPRANAYAALDNLSRKGAVQPASENPVRFIPVDPNILFQRIAEDTTGKCDAIAYGLNLIKQPPEPSYVWSIPNQAQCRSKIDELIESAQKRVWFKANDTDLLPHLEPLQRAGERGIEIVIIFFGTDTTLAQFKSIKGSIVYRHEGNGTHVGHSDQLLTMAVDNTEGLTANLRKGGYGIHTRNRPVVELISSLIRHEIYLAEIFLSFRPQIEDRFGTMLMSLRERFLAAEFVDDLKERLATDESTEPRRVADG